MVFIDSLHSFQPKKLAYVPIRQGPILLEFNKKNKVGGSADLTSE